MAVRVEEINTTHIGQSLSVSGVFLAKDLDEDSVCWMAARVSGEDIGPGAVRAGGRPLLNFLIRAVGPVCGGPYILHYDCVAYCKVESEGDELRLRIESAEFRDSVDTYHVDIAPDVS